MYVCAFIGHSDCPEDVKEKLLLEIENLIVNEKVNTFYVGTQGAFDRLVYEVLCELEKEYKIIINVALAYLNREDEFTYYDTEKTIFPDCLAKTPPRFAIMIVVCRNAKNRFDSRFYRLRIIKLLNNFIMHNIHCNGYSRIFKENSLPNQIFGVETVKFFTVSTKYNHYNTSK